MCTFDSIIGPISLFEEHNCITQILLKSRSVYKDELNQVMRLAKCQIEAYLEGDSKIFDFPYFVDATEFERSVLKAMSTIPYGKTESYKGLAELSGNDRAYRAVGSVCRKNKLPILFPCHRVIKSDGAIGEYSGGIAIKKQLLNIEKNYTID